MGQQYIYLGLGSNLASYRNTQRVSTSRTTTGLHVKAIFGGDFILPPDCYLVSGIYQISISEQFKKNVTLHLPHAAIIKSEEEASYFRFYTADCSRGPLYQLKRWKVVPSYHFKIQLPLMYITLAALQLEQSYLPINNIFLRCCTNHYPIQLQYGIE